MTKRFRLSHLLRVAITAIPLLALPFGTASAQSVDRTDDSAPARPFNGFYFGAESGFDHGRLDLGTGLLSLSDEVISETGVYVGGLVGWRHQFRSNIVFGLEYGFGYSTVKKTVPYGIGTFTLKHGFYDRAGAMLGYAFGKERRSLLFASTGFTLTGSTAGGDDVMVSVGGGYEFAWKGKSSLRLSASYGERLDFFGFEQSQTRLTLSLIRKF